MTAVPKPALAAGVTTTPAANGRWLLSAGDIGTVTPAVHTPPGGPPYAELDLGAALPLILQFRTLGGLDALIGAAVTARAGLGEAQARHDAKQAYDERDRDGWPQTWSELRGKPDDAEAVAVAEAGLAIAETGDVPLPERDSDVQPDPYIGAIAAEHVTEYEPGSPLATPDGIDGLAVQDVPLPEPACPYLSHPDHDPSACLHCATDEQLEGASAELCGQCGEHYAVPGTDLCGTCGTCAENDAANQPLPDLPHRDPGRALEELAAAEPAAGRTVYPQLTPEALAGEEPLESLAAEPEGDTT